MKVTIHNLKTLSPNVKEHWGKKSRRNADHRLLLRCHLRHLIPEDVLPCKVIFTRLAPRPLDSDNLITSMKHCRDVVADMLVPGKSFGQADSDPRITWQYEQKKGGIRNYALEVEIIPEKD